MVETSSGTKANLYELLQVERTATAANIKTAYKKLALKWHPDKHPEADRERATEQFKEISAAYQVLSNEKKRAYYDKYGRVEGDEEDMEDAEAFMDDIMRQFFGGASDISDFDSFIEIIEGGNDKAFRGMFRDMGKATRISKQQPRNARKAALNKKGGGSRAQRQMEKDMMEMMGADMMMGGDMMMDEMMMMSMMMGGMPPGAGKKGKKASFPSDEELLQEVFEEEMMRQAASGGKKGKKAGGFNEEELLEQMMADLMGGKPKGSKSSKKKSQNEEPEVTRSGGQEEADGDWETDSDDSNSGNPKEPVREVPEDQANAEVDGGDWETDSD